MSLVLFNSSSSLVVAYELLVSKEESAVIQSNLLIGFKEHRGSFAGSAVDVNAVSSSGNMGLCI